ncbi:(2Fe-2S)-binding protein [Paenibacillus piri]|uniref:(2Fe-2S)-binding protein n=1 Tax=Paenibacillus piri TaxID=2547395 RepID=A0A4R5KBX9_9BACL|nr:(2Fe-2S)-binding protein [Paenibacillus piri]TDF92018.1 (2Fe-2S)-binding protein [Paenibacillus piri]
MSMVHSNTLNLTINGRDTQVAGDFTETLADLLRERLGLTGTKIGCRTGECGACTVLMDGKPVVSCLIPAASAEGHNIQTIERLSQEEDFGRLVQAMLETGGVQCGFCTPGIMVTLWAWLQDRSLFGGDIGSALKNNLCRCTGYQSIIAAVEQVIAAEKGAQE